MKTAPALDHVLRKDRGRLLAALVLRTGDFQRAEDALQEAAASALVHWERAGIPASPTAWLLRAALRKAIDSYRRDTTLARHRDAIATLALEEAATPDPHAIPDDRLRLIFTCCHPALEEKTRVALTLRSLCGLSTDEVAAVFLDAGPTMGQRLSRARAKIAATGIPFAVPDRDLWPGRLQSVLTVIYLIYTRGHALGPASPRDLCDEALYLARLVVSLAPEDPEAEGCLALLLLTQARAPARIDTKGETVALAEQDRSLWSTTMICEGHAVLDDAIARGRPGPFQLKAAIAALHAAEGPTDWPQIAALYTALGRYEPTPVVGLNHAVALAEAEGAAAGLPLIEALAGELKDYQPFHAARAEYLFRSGRIEDAAQAYDRAIALALSDADREFLVRRRARLHGNLPKQLASEKKRPDTRSGQVQQGGMKR